MHACVPADPVGCSAPCAVAPRGSFANVTAPIANCKLPAEGCSRADVFLHSGSTLTQPICFEKVIVTDNHYRARSPAFKPSADIHYVFVSMTGNSSLPFFQSSMLLNLRSFPSNHQPPFQSFNKVVAAFKQMERIVGTAVVCPLPSHLNAAVSTLADVNYNVNVVKPLRYSLSDDGGYCKVCCLVFRGACLLRDHLLSAKHHELFMQVRNIVSVNPYRYLSLSFFFSSHHVPRFLHCRPVLIVACLS